jgi:hypothetical protein
MSIEDDAEKWALVWKSVQWPTWEEWRNRAEKWFPTNCLTRDVWALIAEYAVDLWSAKIALHERLSRHVLTVFSTNLQDFDLSKQSPEIPAEGHFSAICSLLVKTMYYDLLSDGTWRSRFDFILARPLENTSLPKDACHHASGLLQTIHSEWVATAVLLLED